MATRPSDIPRLESQIAGLQQRANTYQGMLNASPTALGGEGTPTSLDISRQTSLEGINKQIQALQDKRLKTKWYGTDAPPNAASEEAPRQGFIGKTLDFISRPLYGIVGGVKHFTGQGKGSLYQDIADNMMREKSTFGDVLSRGNTPWGVAAPLGLALDIMFDPVNWATMGTGAFIPKIAMGAYKGVRTGEGVAKGVALAGKAGFLEKAVKIGKYTPFVSKTGGFAKLGEKAVSATAAWENMSGITAERVILNRDADLLGMFRKGVKGTFDKVIQSSPKAQEFLQHFVYDPVDWVRQSRIKDIFQQTLGSKADLKGAINAYAEGKPIEPFLAEVTQEMAEKTKSMAAKPLGRTFGINPDVSDVVTTSEEVDRAVNTMAREGLDKKFIDSSKSFVKNSDDAVSVANDADGIFVTADPFENAARIANEDPIGVALRRSNEAIGGGITLEDVQKIVNSGALNETGVKWFDNMMRGIRDYTINVDRNSGKAMSIGKKTMESYDKALGIFRVAKVAASPSSWLNAVVGNLLMTHMAGGSIGPRFLKRLNDARNLYFGKNAGKAAELDRLLMLAGGSSFDKSGVLQGPDLIRKGLEEYRTAAKSSLGDLAFVGSKSSGKKGLVDYVREELSLKGRDAGIINGNLDAEEMAAAIADIKMEATHKIADASMEARLKISEVEAGKSIAKKSRETIAEAGGLENVSKYDIGSGLVSQELYSSNAAADMFNYIAKRAAEDPGNSTFKVLDAIFNKMPEGYEKIDQSFKMATFVTATVDGYSMNELRRISKLIDINPEELGKIVVEGETRYTLSARSALELGNVMYLNYAAMPSAIKVMRNLPLLGSPFVSFMYGMTLKTGQTLANNPAAFNKVGFTMSEFGGSKTPLEKKALSTPFYSYLNQPGMMRLPVFFEKNPVYVNMASMVPYYSLNMFNPTRTTYGDSVREQFVQAFQDSPVMKDPVGSTLFDYFIQPLILGESIRPQGQFGQPLYPIDATAIEKAGYGARTLGEAFVPNVMQYAGLVTPESVANYIPSYRWRQLSHAKGGKNQLGISGKEPAAQRTLRTLLSSTGIPVQTPVNTTFGSKE